MIPIYIGISDRFKEIEGLTENSILENTSAEVQITHLYPKHEAGCTGFTNVRYQIEHGIYLDCDMLILGDIAELWEYRQKGKFVCMRDGSSEVAVIDCRHNCKTKQDESLIPKACVIPDEWNVEDYKYFPDKPLPEVIKNFHFTSLGTQPWFYDHPHQEAVNLYERYRYGSGQI